MQIAVTGATGHVGCNLVRTLVERGHSVRAVIHHERGGLDGVAVQLVEADVTDGTSLERAFAGCELVFHLAARISISAGDEDLVHATNVIGPRNVAAACLAAKVRRLVHFSSIHAFDAHPLDGIIDETRPLAPSIKKT